MRLPDLTTEPVALLVGAAILVALGVELAPLTEAAETIVQLVTLVGGTALARGRAWAPASVDGARRQAAQQVRAELAPDPGTPVPNVDTDQLEQ